MHDVQENLKDFLGLKTSAEFAQNHWHPVKIWLEFDTAAEPHLKPLKSADPIRHRPQSLHDQIEYLRHIAALVVPIDDRNRHGELAMSFLGHR